MDGGIDWFWFALTVPLVPTVAIIGALFWLRSVRLKRDPVEATLDDPPGIYLAGEPEPAPMRGADGRQHN